jgi:hypothetical protein
VGPTLAGVERYATCARRVHQSRLSEPAGEKILECAPLNRLVVMLAEQSRQLTLVYPGLCAYRLKVFV